MALQLTRLLVTDDDCDPRETVRLVKSWPRNMYSVPIPILSNNLVVVIGMEPVAMPAEFRSVS